MAKQRTKVEVQEQTTERILSALEFVRIARRGFRVVELGIDLESALARIVFRQ